MAAAIGGRANSGRPVRSSSPGAGSESLSTSFHLRNDRVVSRIRSTVLPELVGLRSWLERYRKEHHSCTRQEHRSSIHSHRSRRDDACRQRACNRWPLEQPQLGSEEHPQLGSAAQPQLGSAAHPQLTPPQLLNRNRRHRRGGRRRAALAWPSMMTVTHNRAAVPTAACSKNLLLIANPPNKNQTPILFGSRPRPPRRHLVTKTVLAAAAAYRDQLFHDLCRKRPRTLTANLDKGWETELRVGSKTLLIEQSAVRSRTRGNNLSQRKPLSRR